MLGAEFHQQEWLAEWESYSQAKIVSLTRLNTNTHRIWANYHNSLT